MRVADMIGKTIVDAAGNEIGRSDDFEVDVVGGTIDAVVVKGKGSLAAQLDSERLDSLLKKLKVSKSEDLLIPFGDIQSVGKYIVLKKALKASLK